MRARATLGSGGIALGWRTCCWLLVAPTCALMLVFYLSPIVRVLWISVTDPRPGLGNYALLYQSASILRVLATTARISATTTLVTLVLGYLVAYALVHASPRRQRLMLLGVLLSFWISVLVRAFAWVTLLRDSGLVNTALIRLGIVGEPLPLVRNELGVTIGMVHFMLPYAVLPLYANMRGIDHRLVAAARGLGASRLEAFAKVFLPLSLPGLVGAGVLVFVLSLGFFVTPAILGGGKTVMIAEYVQLQILDLLRWGTGTMLATTLVGVVFVILGVLARFVDVRRLFGASRP